MTRTRNDRRVGVLSVLALVLVVAMLAVYQPAPIQGQATAVPTMEPGIAEQIRSGAIDVGDEYSIEPGGRFHTIHARTLDMDCETCHVEEMSEVQAMFYVQGDTESRSGAVAREVCLVCHQGGEATEFYGPVE